MRPIYNKLHAGYACRPNDMENKDDCYFPMGLPKDGDEIVYRDDYYDENDRMFIICYTKSQVGKGLMFSPFLPLLYI